MQRLCLPVQVIHKEKEHQLVAGSCVSGPNWSKKLKDVFSKKLTLSISSPYHVNIQILIITMLDDRCRSYVEIFPLVTMHEFFMGSMRNWASTGEKAVTF